MTGLGTSCVWIDGWVDWKDRGEGIWKGECGAGQKDFFTSCNGYGAYKAWLVTYGLKQMR